MVRDNCGKILKLRSESNVANVGNFNADNGLNVNNWNRDKSNDNVFAAPLAVSSLQILFKVMRAWLLLSSHQASFLFLARMLEVRDSSCRSWLEYLLRALEEFLKDQV